MMIDLMYLVGIFLVLKYLYRGIRFFKGGKHKKRKSILGKIIYLVLNKIHHELDRCIRSQKAKYEPKPSNVVAIEGYRNTHSK